MSSIHEIIKNKNQNRYYISNVCMFNKILSVIKNSKSVIAVKKTILNDQELLNWIESNVPQLNGYNIYTKLNWILHDIHDFPTCQYCHKVLPKIEISIFRCYHKWCSEKHMRIDPLYKQYLGDRLEQKYGKGIRSILQVPEIRAKIKNTWKEKYGVDNPLKAEEVKNKAKQTFIKHYGVDNNMKSKKGMQEYKNAMQEKYGVDYSWQLKSTIEKAKQTSYERYGVYITSQSQQAKDKQEKTNLERYGSKSALQNKECHAKAIQTCISKYGTEHQSQSKTVRDKARKKYTYDNQSFDSSWELAFWIYCKDNNIDIKRCDVSFEYFDKYNVKHYYFPDFILNNNQYIEIKGDDQFDKNGKMIDKLDHSKDYIAEAKHQCMISNNITIFKYDEVKKYLDYITENYGKSYLKQFKNK